MNVLRGKHDKPERDSGTAYKVFWKHRKSGGLMPFYMGDGFPYREGVDGWIHWDFKRFKKTRDAVVRGLGPGTQAPGAVKEDKQRSGFCLFKRKEDALRAIEGITDGGAIDLIRDAVLAKVEYLGCIGEVDNLLMAGKPRILVCRSFKILEKETAEEEEESEK